MDFSCSEQVESPLTLGWLKPVILVPSAMLMAMPADTYFLRVKLNGQYETRRVIVQ